MPTRALSNSTRAATTSFATSAGSFAASGVGSGLTSASANTAGADSNNIAHRAQRKSDELGIVNFRGVMDCFGFGPARDCQRSVGPHSLAALATASQLALVAGAVCYPERHCGDGVMSDNNQFQLLRERRFLPFFLTQALGAFNDNVFRNATVILIGFEMGLSTEQITTYSNFAPALFILPFFLFSASAGQIAEKFEKTRVIRFVKLFEIAAMSIAAYGFLTHNATVLLSVLFLMGLHSTLFGPIKYAILPQALRNDELVGGNGLVEMGTSLSILLGMMLGGSLIAAAGQIGPLLASIAVIVIAVIGYVVCLAIPAAPAAAPELRFNWNFFTETWRAIGFVAHNRTVFNAVLGISWFWFFGIVFTAQLPNYTKLYLGGTDG